MILNKDKTRFIDEVISGNVNYYSDLLFEAIQWIKENLSPEDVFEEGDIADWAKRNGFTKEQKSIPEKSQKG